MDVTNSIREFLDALTEFWQSAGGTLDRQRQLSKLPRSNYVPEREETLDELRRLTTELDAASTELRNNKANVLSKAVEPPIPMFGIPAAEWLRRVRLDVELLARDLPLPQFTPEVEASCCERLKRLGQDMEDLLALPPSKPSEQVVSVASSAITYHERLVAIQRRVRELATRHSSIKLRLQQAFEEMVLLHDEYDDKKARYARRQYELAREAVVAQPSKNHDAGFDAGWEQVSVQGLCPMDVFNRTKGLAFDENHRRRGRSFDRLPVRDRESVNRCAIAALEWQLEFDDASPEKQEQLYAERLQKHRAGSHVFSEYFVWIAPPTDVERPVDPIERASDGLLKFPVAQRESIALYWLGAIADAGWPFPLIDKPSADYGNRYIAWERRAWVHADRDAGAFVEDDAHLSADLAEAFMLQLETMASAELLGKPRHDRVVTEARLTAEQACKQYVVEANTLRLRSERETWDVSRTPGGMRMYRRVDLEAAGYKLRSTVQPRKVVRKSKNDRE